MFPDYRNYLINRKALRRMDRSSTTQNISKLDHSQRNGSWTFVSICISLRFSLCRPPWRGARTFCFNSGQLCIVSKFQYESRFPISEQNSSLQHNLEGMVLVNLGKYETDKYLCSFRFPPYICEVCSLWLWSWPVRQDSFLSAPGSVQVNPQKTHWTHLMRGPYAVCMVLYIQRPVESWPPPLWGGWDGLFVSLSFDHMPVSEYIFRLKELLNTDMKNKKSKPLPHSSPTSPISWYQFRIYCFTNLGTCIHMWHFFLIPA